MQISKMATTVAAGPPSISATKSPEQPRPVLHPHVLRFPSSQAWARLRLGAATVVGVAVAAAVRRSRKFRAARGAAATARTLAPGISAWQFEEDIRFELGGVRLFLDTADASEWDRLLPMGFFSGVTTDPVSLSKAGVPCNVPSLNALLEKAIAHPCIREVMFQAWGEDHESLYKVACELQDLDPRVVVKLPLTDDGIRAAAMLRSEKPNARICMTACCAAKQTLVAGGLYADYISADLNCMGPLDTGLRDCAQMQEAFGDKSAIRVLVVSCRSIEQVMSLASKGLASFSLSPPVADELVNVPQTIAAAREFEKAARDNNGAKKRGRRKKLAEPVPTEILDNAAHEGELAHEHA